MLTSSIAAGTLSGPPFLLVFLIFFPSRPANKSATSGISSSELSSRSILLPVNVFRGVPISISTSESGSSCTTLDRCFLLALAALVSSSSEGSKADALNIFASERSFIFLHVGPTRNVSKTLFARAGNTNMVGNPLQQQFRTLSRLSDFLARCHFRCKMNNEMRSHTGLGKTYAKAHNSPSCKISVFLSSREHSARVTLNSPKTGGTNGVTYRSRFHGHKRGLARCH